MSLHVLDDAGSPLDAHLDLDRGEIVYHSRGGTRGAPSARNLDYGVALRLLLHRAAATGHRLRGVWVDSDEVLSLPREKRSILGGADLLASPRDQFRILSRNMQTFGRALDAAYGGSRVKKIRINGEWPPEEDAIRAILGLGTGDSRGMRKSGDVGALVASVIADTASDAGSLPGSPAGAADDGDTPVFDPSSIEDGRQQIATMVKRRQGQSGFRRILLRAYGTRCAITGCGVEPLLEAAHIHPYRGPDTNSVQNGMLLRADVHTLFDLGLITVSSEMRIVVSPTLAGTDYAALEGRTLRLPKSPSDRPSDLAFAWHRNEHVASVPTSGDLPA